MADSDLDVDMPTVDELSDDLDPLDNSYRITGIDSGMILLKQVNA